MSEKKVNNLYKQAWNYMKRSGRISLDFDDKAYNNVLSAIFPCISSDPLYCEDIMLMCVDRFLEEDIQKDSIDDNRGEQLIDNIRDTFKLNSKEHYLLIPINGARLSKDISFSIFDFIIGDENEKEEKIENITGIERNQMHQYLEHTKKSRSKDFLQNPLLLMKIDNVNENVRRSASLTAQRIFRIIKLIVYYLETEESIYEMAEGWYDDNYHVGIVGKDSWQMGHGVWWSLIRCKYSLDFLSDKEHQDMFCRLVQSFISEPQRDELYYKFANALELFGKSLEQVENYRDATLSMMLLFSAAESLLTEKENEKKLRLAVIWTRIVTITNKDRKDLGKIIRDTYAIRNDFVHAGNLIYSDDNVELRILHQMLAKLIMLYLQTDKWKGEKTGKDITIWNDYIKEIFSDAIYG